MKKNRALGRFLLIFLIYNALVIYIGYHGWLWGSHLFGRLSPFLYWLVFVLIAYSYLLGQGKGPAVFKVIGAYWFGVLEYGVIILPFADIAGAIASRYASSHEVIVWMGAAVLAILLLIFAKGTYNAYQPIVRRYSITVPKPAGAHERLRLAVASDMHFGLLSGQRHARRLVEELKQLQPDMILYPGDIIDDNTQHFLRKDMHLILGSVQAPLGTYGVLGNHEYYGGEIDTYTEIMKQQNIPILRDEIVTIDEAFYVIGRNDHTDKKRKSVAALTEGLNKEKPLLLLDHQPLQLSEAMEAGIDVSFSGHTHRGQMAPNHLLTKKLFELDWGYKQKNQLHAFVSSGYGFWGPPLRIGSRSEILAIEILFSPAAQE